MLPPCPSAAFCLRASSFPNLPSPVPALHGSFEILESSEIALAFELCGSLAYNQRVSGPFTEPINARTRYCAVFGHPVKHSASPAMQNAGIAALGLNWRYLAFEVHPDDLCAAVEGAKAMRFIGINLTVPHKLPAWSIMNVVDKNARLCGAVNTVRFEGLDEQGQWCPLRLFHKGGSGRADEQRHLELQTKSLTTALAS